MTGTVFLVGAGPGDPGLLTLRGGELLVTCDAVVYDALANPALLALASVRDRAEPIELHDVGKRGGASESARQQEINDLLVKLAREGKRVVRLKGGDPFVFGRGSEEAQALAAAGIAFEVVPGVTAGIAAPAYAGIPVTHRGVSTSVTFVTGHEDPGKGALDVDWAALARAGGTIVLYMGVKTLPRTTAALLAGGMKPGTPAAAVQWGTYPTQRTVTATLSTLVDAIAAAKLAAPVITVIGPVTRLRDEIAWFDRRPLFGKRIVVTRASAQSASLTSRLAAAGADVIEMPATRIEAFDARSTHATIKRLGKFDWLILTSQNAVRILWDALRDAKRDARAFAGLRIAAVGPATADALLERGIVVDVTPERFVAESLLAALADRKDLRGARVLYAPADAARDVLPRGLEELGAKVERVALYRSVPDAEGTAAFRERLAESGAEVITFTSASTVKAFVEAASAGAARDMLVASIGPITSAAVRDAGLEVAIEAATSTIDGLVDAVIEHFARRRGAEE